MSDEVRVEVSWDGERIKQADRAAAALGLNLAMEHLLQVADELVPIEEGTLMRSGTASVDDDELVGAVTFSAYNDRDHYDYAIRQHEDLALRHAPGRTAKFLENPANEERDTMLQIVAEQIRRANQ